MYLWEISMMDKTTGEKVSLKVPANTNDEATHKVTDMGCFGAKGPYKWCGTGPVYDKAGNRVVANQ